MAPFYNFCGKVLRFDSIDVDLLFDFNMVIPNPNYIGANAYSKCFFINKPIAVMRNFLFVVRVKFDVVFFLAGWRCLIREAIPLTSAGLASPPMRATQLTPAGW